MMKGREVKTCQEWQDCKVKFMDRLLHEQARQCPMSVKAILETGDASRVENTINDYWGRGKKFTG